VFIILMLYYIQHS